MADSDLPPSVDEINLNSSRFWSSSAAEREAAFDLLRDERPVSFHPRPRDSAHCLGASLARREITVMFRELMQRLPDLEISGEPQLLHSPFSNGIARMPCTFTPGGSAG